MASIQTAITIVDRVSAPMQNINNSLNTTVANFEKLDRATEEVDVSSDKLAGTIGKLVSAYALLDVAKKAIDYASDLQEVQNVVDVTFENSSAVVDAWAKTTLEAYGLNQLSAKKYAGTMGAMLKSSGLTGGAVTDMSMRLTELAGDMASFYNLAGDEAFGKIRAGISGETEPLKQLGINMSVANLEAYALSQGIDKAYNSMSQGEQIMLRYNYLLQATADAQGDFSRTSDSFANQTKLLKESWLEFTGKLATVALPILASVMGFLNTVIGWLSDNAGLVVGALALISGAVIGYGIAVKGASIAQAIYNSALWACPLTWIIVGIIAVIGIIYGVIQAINKLTGKTISAGGVIMGALNTAVAFIWNLFLGLTELILGCINELVNPFIRFGNFLANLFTNPISSIIYLFQGMADATLSVLQKIASAMDFVFGSNMAGTIQGWRDGLQTLADDAVKKYAPNENYEKVMNELDLSVDDFGLKRYAYTDAYADGYAFGENLGEGIGDTLAMDYGLDAMGEDVSAIKDSLDTTNEELKYMRDLAERDAINRFTTAEIKIDMTNNNNIENHNDLDGIIDGLTERLFESMTLVASGV